MRQGLMRVMAAIGAAGSTCALFTDATPWVYPELTRGIELRREKEARLRHYVARMGPVVASLSERRSFAMRLESETEEQQQQQHDNGSGGESRYPASTWAVHHWTHTWIGKHSSKFESHTVH
mmetsp:Transcript_1929/g.3133  ORF Transcript_1929/g.3133 Transcript_1929/m.3133 type:complete len:122 (+) Transcript_1929:403-768(+)